jgi:transmembrane sensor
MNAVDFIKFLTNEANEKEKLAFYQKLEKDKKLEKEFLEVKKIWIEAKLDNIIVPTNRKKQLFSEFWEKREKAKKRLLPYSSKVFRYAAILILILSLPFVFFLGKKKGSSTETYTTISCALGDKTEIVLPDSSKVFLNSGSKLIFNNNFDEGERQVFLDGEAFFSVAIDKNSPFIVTVNEIKVEVLGTEFNIKAYPEENKISTTLIEGSLNVSVNNQNVVIKPSQKLIYYKESKLIKLQSLADTTPETEWKEGRLVFRNESLADMELKLERWFDVDIDFADDVVKTKRFTGILERESILEAISYFGYSKYVGYTINGNEITFYSKN